MSQYAPFGSTQLDPRLTGEGSPQGVPVSGNEFSKGLRRGGYGALISLNTLAGAAGQALGADDFAAGRLRAADEAAAEAAAPALAPRVPTLRDIGGVGDAASWLAGKAGEIAPVTAATIGATALTGGGAVPAALAVTGTMAPVEIGSVLARQRAQGAPMSLRTAVPAGLGSAALWGVVPGLARAAKVPGGALMAVPEQALLSGGSEGLQQAGAGEQFDPHKIGEAMAEGAVMGVPFAAQHALTSNAGAIKSGIGKAGEALGSAAEAAKAKLGAAKDATVEAAGVAKDATVAAAKDAAEKFEGYEIPTRLSDVFDSAKAKAQAWMKNVAEKRETMADPQDIVGDGSNPDLGPALAKDDASRMQQGWQWVKDVIEEHVPENVRDKVQSAFSDLSSNVGMKASAAKASIMRMADAQLTPEQAAAVKNFVANPGDVAAQAAVAGMKMSADAAKTVATHVNNFATKAQASWQKFSSAVKAKGDELRDAKKSEDDSGVIAAIAQQVRPVIEEVRPDLYGPGADPEVQRTFARGLRHLVDTIAHGGHADSDALIDLMSVTGNRTADVIEAAYKAVGSTDKAKTADVFRELNSIADLQASHETLVDTLRKNVVPEYKRLLSPATAHEMASGLMQWAQRTRGAAGDAEFTFKDRQIRNEVKRYFGENTPAVYAAVEKALPKEKTKFESPRAKTDEEGNAIGEETYGLRDFEMPGADAKFDLHPAANNLMYDHPESPTATFGKFGPPVEQRMKKLREKHPTRITMLSAEDLGENHPLVKQTRQHFVRIAEGLGLDGERYADEKMSHMVVPATERLGELTGKEFEAMRLDAKRFGGSPSRIDTGEGGPILDAMRVTKIAWQKAKDAREPWSEGENRVSHMAHMFANGIALAQEHLGHAFEIPDSTVIGKFGGKDLVWGKAKKYVVRTAEDRATDTDTAKLEALRDEYMRAKGLKWDAEQKKVVETRPDPGVRPLKDIQADAQRILEGREWRKSAELTRDDDRSYREDEVGFNDAVDSGIDLGKLTHGRSTKDNLQEGVIGGPKPGTTQTGFVGHPREQRIRELRAEYSRLGQLMESDKATAADRVKATAVRREIEQLERLHEAPGGSGQREVDPFGQIHQAGGYGRREPSEITTNLTGLSREEDLQGLHRPAKSNPDAEQLPHKGPGAKEALGSKAQAVPKNEDDLVNEYRQGRLGDFTIDWYDGQATVDTTKYGKFTVSDETAYSLMKESPGPKARAAEAAARSGESEAAPAERKAAFLERARAGDPKLIDEINQHDDPKGLQRAVLALNRPHGADRENVQRVTDALNKRIGELVNRDEETRYGMLLGQKKYSLERVKESPFLNRHASGVDEIEVFGKVWNLGDRVRAVEATHAATLGGKREKIQRGKVYVEGFTEDESQFSGWVNSLVEARQYAEQMGVQTQEPVRAQARPAPNDIPFSHGPTGPGTVPLADAKAAEDWVRTTFGRHVVTAWEHDLGKMPHAGEAFRSQVPNPVTGTPYTDFIRLSAHALNPMSTAFHEAMHTFVRHLTDQKMGHITDVLLRAADAAPVLNQLRKIMKDRGFGDKALAQLNDREERAAYMYQFWADGSLKVGDQTKGVLGKIADFIRSVLGIWSNDERAVHIMKYLHEGDYGKDIGSRNLDEVFQRKLMDVHRNAVLEQAKRMTEPFRNMGEALAVAGGQRLRDTGIPALAELSNIMKAHGTAESKDAGWVPAAGAQHRRMVTEMFRDLKGYSPEQIRAAVESLQTKTNASIDNFVDPQARANVRLAKKAIRAHLDKAYEYMQIAGVNLKDMGYGKDYFPRVYDPDYISRHQQAFKDVLDKYQVKDSEKVMKQIMAGEGADFTVETDKPGMQHLKPRTLAHIPDAELAPFMERDGLRILNGYMKQAARRAEWDRREMSAKLPALLDRAAREGATPDDLKAAQNFIRATDGTLGDTINPEARRLMGNMIVYQNLRLLPLGIFSSAVDPLGIVVRGGKVSDAFSAFKRGVTEIAKNFKSDTDVGKDAATQFAEDVGTIDNTMLTRVLGANYSQGMVGDTGRRINDQLFRWNFMEQFNNSMRVAATEAAMGFLKKHADGNASAHSERYLAELGLKPGDVKIDSATGRVKVFEHDGLTADESTAMKAALNRWVDGAVLRPDAVDVPVWMNDPHFALLAHLKRFTYAFHETILKRVAHEYQNGNYAPAMALASYVPTMIAADLVKGLIQGGGAQPSFKQDWDFWDYVESGIERGGLYGTSQFAVDAFGNIRHGGSGIGALTGPTVDQLTQAIKVLGGREQFNDFAVHSMPANALYGGLIGHAGPDAKFPD